jgi:hypothetical protein
MNRVKFFKAKDGTLFNSYNECLEYETKDYPKINGYTCYGKCYLSNTLIENKTFYEAMEIKEEIIFPNGEKETAHVLSVNEIKKIAQKCRARKKSYWTSTEIYEHCAYLIEGEKGRYQTHLKREWCGAIPIFDDKTKKRCVCLGFKNPFYK